MAYVFHIAHLLILGVCGTLMLVAVVFRRNPLAQAAPQVRLLTVAFLVTFWLVEMVDVLENLSSAPSLASVWAVFGSVSGSLASLILLRVRQPPSG